VARATITRFAESVGYAGADYQRLWRWSIDDVETFWQAICGFYDVLMDGDPTCVLRQRAMPGARWFPDVALSYAEHIFRGHADEDVALHHAAELGHTETWTWGRLREETASVRAGFVRMGVTRGDRVAAYLPNLPETVAAFLATASLGATWSCCSPDFGVRSVIDRFAQIEPKVLLTVDGYRYGGRDFDRREAAVALRKGLPTVERTATLGRLQPDAGDWRDSFPSRGSTDLEFERVPFDHPLWILYSSGTTGLPKAIVQGHGGILLEHLKLLSLHMNLQESDVFFWYTTTGWMMWNVLVSGLLTQAQIVLFDGNPGVPNPDVLWDLAAETHTTCFGTSAAYVHACMKRGARPTTSERDLSRVNAVGSTGSPLSPEGFRWIYDSLGSDVWLFSTSGGTDVCSAFLGGTPLEPVYLGELQARSLGADVCAFDEKGREVVEEVGELVVRQPMPSMPVSLWNDPAGARYRDAYFSVYRGVWRHGDWIRITTRGSAVIYGRSDSTINRGGIRMGTAEIYRAALREDEVLDALVLDIPGERESDDSWMPLFVVLAPGAELTSELRSAINRRIREDCSPRHVPDSVVVVPEVPRTLSGKVLEIPLKRLLMGADPEEVASRGSLANPEAYDWFIGWAQARRTGG
jgi:acetoacetyl-CoA synthetase